MLYTCNSGNNDDWYWIYAALGLGPGGDFVSNDEMRDHNFNLSEHRAFKIWRERHAIKFDFIKRQPLEPREMVIFKPTSYSFRMQVDADLNWHLPSKRPVPVDIDEADGADTDVSKMETLWMCLRRGATGGTGIEISKPALDVGKINDSEERPAPVETVHGVHSEIQENSGANRRLADSDYNGKASNLT